MYSEHENCNGCGRPMHRYKRKITMGMKEFLLILYRLNKNKPDQKYFHYREIITNKSGGLDYSLNESFGLIERKSATVSRTVSNGLWRITPAGIGFVESKVSVPKFLYIYMGRVEGESNEQVFINQVGKNKFNLEEAIQISEN
jgi:hypothetical protein